VRWSAQSSACWIWDKHAELRSRVLAYPPDLRQLSVLGTVNFYHFCAQHLNLPSYLKKMKDEWKQGSLLPWEKSIGEQIFLLNQLAARTQSCDAGLTNQMPPQDFCLLRGWCVEPSAIWLFRVVVAEPEPRTSGQMAVAIISSLLWFPTGHLWGRKPRTHASLRSCRNCKSNSLFLKKGSVFHFLAWEVS
jgi:hypothetical protein